MQLTPQTTLSDVAARLAVLRSVTRPAARAGVLDMMPELVILARTEQITEGTRIDLLTKAARLIRADTFRADTPAEALEQLQDVVAGTVGGPPIGPPLTVRFPAEVHETLDTIANDEGLLRADGTPRRAAVVRRLVGEALAARAAQPTPGQVRKQMGVNVRMRVDGGDRTGQ